jgi:predicted phage-related endonuclease
LLVAASRLLGDGGVVGVVQLDAQRPLLSCSQLGQAVGVGFSSPIALWCELTGRVPAREQSEAMYWGKHFQPLIFQRLRELGYAADESVQGEVRDAAIPWLVGHPDGYAWGPYHPFIVEAKAQAHPHADLSAEVQTLAYMRLAGADFKGGILATLAGLRLEVRELERREPVIDLLLERGEAFAEYVRRDEQPPVTGHPKDRDALLLAHPHSARGKLRRETSEQRTTRRELRRALAQEKALKVRIDHLRTSYTETLGDVETVIGRDSEAVASWQTVATSRFDTETFKAEHPDLYEQYLNRGTTRRFTLK